MRIKNNKSNIGPELIAALIITVIIILIVTGLIKNPFSTTASTTKTELLKAADKKCLYDADRAIERGTDFIDADKDGRPDSCDICIIGTGSNNDVDADLDGLPDACDSADDDRLSMDCGDGTKKTKDGRCAVKLSTKKT